MVITINTDASFNRKHQIATYAFWIVSNLGRIKMSGRLKGNIMHSTHAEMLCICNALYVVTRMEGWTQPGNRIIINTDSMNAVHLFTKDKFSIRKYRLHAQQKFKAKSDMIVHQFFLLKYKFKKSEFTFAHVKAHVEVASPRTYVNDWADKSAKEEMRKYIIDKETKVKTPKK